MPTKTLTKKSNLDRYSGKWVAFLDQKIVVSADTLKNLDKKVTALNFKKKPVYFLMPRKDEGPYVLIAFPK